MARRPFFSGNYGSALGSTANAANLIARAGATQGQMYANMGAQIGGMIQQYGLNKEKRRKEEDTAMGTLAGMNPQELLQIGQENPKLGKAIERATSDQATPRDFQLINASAAPIMARKARELDTRFKTAQIEGIEFKNKLNEANKENLLLRSTMETEGAKLINDLRKQQVLISEIEKDLKSNERDYDTDKRNTDLAKAKEVLASLKEDVIAKRNNNLVFKEQLEAQKTKDAVALSEAMSRLQINAEKLDQLRASRDVDLKTKEENLKILEAERKTLEQELKNQQNLLNSLSVDGADEGLDFIQPIDIDDAFQADAAGLFYNIVGKIGGAFGADITPETTGQAQNLKMLETFLLPALASDISSRPSNFTLEVARQKIPLPSDRDDVGQRKIEQLIPDLKLRLVEAQNTLKSGNTDASYFQEARTQESRIRKIIPILEDSLKAKNPSVSAGRTSTNVGFKIRGQK